MFVDDLSIVLAYLVENTIITKQFSDQLFDHLKTECSSHDLTIYEAKSKTIRFNPLKQNTDLPLVPFPIVNEMKILGVTFTSDCSFSAHINSTVPFTRLNQASWLELAPSETATYPMIKPSQN